MSLLDPIADALDSLKRAHDAGRLAHAYLVVAPPRGPGTAFATALLSYLFCGGTQKPCGECKNCQRLAKRQHPDAVWIEPEKKSRIISVHQMRELTQGLLQTAYEGGWKAAVLLFADRMNEESSNAFLKTLEEPPGRTLLLLVTDHPQGVLPTIRSRCQRIVLSDVEEETPAWREEVLAILRASATGDAVDALVLAARLKSVLARLRDEIRDADETPEDPDGDVDGNVLDARVQAKVLKERTDILRLMMAWHRDVLAVAMGAGDDVLELPSESAAIRRAAAATPPATCRRALEAVDRMARQFDRSIPEASVLVSGFLAATGR